MEEEKKIDEPTDFDKQDPNPMPMPSEEDQRISRLNHILSTVQRGWKISIMREKPTWCCGHLETIEVFSPEEVIDLDYLARTWGGQRLALKIHDQNGRWVGGASIPLYTYPALRRGKAIYEHDPEPNKTSRSNQYPMYYPTPPQPHTQGLDFGRALEIMAKSKGNDVKSMLQLMDYYQSRTAQPQQNPWDQMMGMLALFKEMKSVFGSFEGLASGSGQGGESSDAFSPVIAEVIKGLITKQNTPVSAVKGSLRPPQNQPLPLTQDRSIVDELSNMDPDQAARTVIQALGNMPETKRERAISEFMESMGEENDIDDLDDSSLSDDNYDDDESIQSELHPNAHKAPNRR